MSHAKAPIAKRSSALGPALSRKSRRTATPSEAHTPFPLPCANVYSNHSSSTDFASWTAIPAAWNFRSLSFPEFTFSISFFRPVDRPRTSAMRCSTSFFRTGESSSAWYFSYPFSARSNLKRRSIVSSSATVSSAVACSSPSSFRSTFFSCAISESIVFRNSASPSIRSACRAM